MCVYKCVSNTDRIYRYLLKDQLFWKLIWEYLGSYLVIIILPHIIKVSYILSSLNRKTFVFILHFLWIKSKRWHFRQDKNNEAIYHVNKQIYLCGARRIVACFLGQNAVIILRLRWMQYFNIKMKFLPLQCKPKQLRGLQWRIYIKLDIYTYKGSFRSNFNGEGGLFGDCQNKPNKMKKYIIFNFSSQ